MEDRELLEALVEEQFDDPPDVLDLVDAAFRLAELRGADGDLDGALDLLDRVAERYGDDPRFAAYSHIGACAVLWQARRYVEAEARSGLAVSWAVVHGDDEVLALALSRRAHLLYEAGRHEDAQIVFQDVLDRFGDHEDSMVAEHVAQSRKWIAHGTLMRGRRLEDAGQTAEAEAAYREAIARGLEGAWADLGALLISAPGRRTEAEEALRVAVASDEVEVAASGALHLAFILRERGEIDAARAHLEMAAERGSPEVARAARRDLADLQGRPARGFARRRRRT